ncbi:MAG: alpha-amylase family protein, partial [Armatimonadota bacterium]
MRVYKYMLSFNGLRGRTERECGRWIALAIAFAAVVVFGIVGGAQAKSLGWGYDTVVKPLPRPTWMENIVIIDSYQNWPFTDGEQTALVPWAQKLKDAGFTIVTYGTLEKAENMHKLGIKVIIGMRPPVAEGWNAEAIKSHPEWWMQTKPGVPVDKEDSACLLSGYGDWLVKALAERVVKYHIDALTFDGWYQYKFCACEACRTGYKNDTGFDAPKKKNGDDPNYRRFLVWRDKKLFEKALALNKAVKAVNPEAVIISWINNDADGAYPSYMPESIDCVFDMVWKEWWNSDDVTSIWLNKRMRGASGDRMVAMQPYLFARGAKDVYAGVYHGSSMPMNEVLYQMHEILTMGEVPILWNGARTGMKPADWEKIVQDWVDYLPYVHNTKTLKYAACLDSFTSLQMSKADANGTFHGDPDKITNPRGGITRALLEAHIPFDVISEHNVSLETLSQYKVIVLPNTYCMSDRIAGVLRDYVAQGGGLVASYETSLYDDMGDRRKDFALADVFGASYLSTQASSACKMNFAEKTHPITDDPAMRDIMGKGGYNTYWGRFTRVKLA